MTQQIAIFGFGPVGQATTEQLVKKGYGVRVVQRKRPDALPAGTAFQPCDVLDGEAVREAAADARQIVIAIGFPYDGKPVAANVAARYRQLHRSVRGKPYSHRVRR